MEILVAFRMEWPLNRGALRDRTRPSTNGLIKYRSMPSWHVLRVLSLQNRHHCRFAYSAFTDCLDQRARTG